MSDQTDKKQKPDSDVDIFNMKPTIKQEAAPAETKAQPHEAKAKQAARSSFFSKLGTIHFSIATLLIMAIWIAWPYLFRHSPPSDVLMMNSPMPVSNQVTTDAGQARQPDKESETQPVSAAKVASETVTTDDRLSATETTASTPPAINASNASAQPTAKELELQAKVNELQDKLALVEAKAAKCVAPVITTNRHQNKAHRVSSTPRRRAKEAPLLRPSTKIDNPGGFTLNTIYRDQAWIQNAERTYVVQVGDVIDGLRIIRIEPAARQVITSLGIIR